MLIFDSVFYHLPASLSPQRRAELSTVLDANGGQEVELRRSKLTHVVTNTNRFEGWEGVKERETVKVVTDQWVDRSMVLGRMQPPQIYSSDPLMIFSSVIACASDIPAPDLEVLSSGLNSLGGSFRTGLTRDCTHLITLSPSNLKYATAMHFQDKTGIKIVLPHWFDDCVRLGMRVGEGEYEWPEPRVLKGLGFDDDNEERGRGGEKEKKGMLKGAYWVPGREVMEAERVQRRDVWGGKRILLSASLELSGGRLGAVRGGVERAGGVAVICAKTKEEEEVEGCDVFVTRWRGGRAYVKAAKMHKTIATLSWLFHVESTGIITRPVDQLLHYPVPKKQIEGFTGHEITLTNYTGESREYLKKLITVMGATFTPSMSGRNTVLIAAYISGNKTVKARSWSIPIVNHIWLEDCFTQWRNLTVGLEKYIVFPPGVDFSKMLGTRSMRGVEVDVGVEVDLDDEEEVGEVVWTPVKGKGDETPRRMRRVEDDQGGGDVDMDVQTPRQGKGESPRRTRRLEPEDDDDDGGGNVEREVVKTPLKKTVTTPRKSRRLEPEHDDDDEGGGVVVVKTPSKTTPRRTRPLAPVELHDDDDNGGGGMDVDEVIVVKTQTPSKRKGESPSKKTARGTKPLEPVGTGMSVNDVREVVSALFDDDDGEDEVSPKAGGSGKKSATKRSVKVSMKPKASPLKGKGKGKSRAVTPEMDSDSEDIQVVLPVTPRAKSKKQQRLEPPTDSESESDLPVDVRSPLTKSKGKDRPPQGSTSPSSNRSPKRLHSVSVPSAPYDLSPVRALSAVGRPDSVRVAAVEGVVDRGGSSRLKRGRERSDDDDENEVPARMALARTPSKRAAAGKASAKLRDEVMPDVMNYQQEMKKAKGRRKRSLDVVESEEEIVEVESRKGKKRKLSSGGVKKKAVSATSDTDSDAVLAVTNGKRKAAVVAEEEESSDEPPLPVKTTKKKRTAVAVEEAESLGQPPLLVKTTKKKRIAVVAEEEESTDEPPAKTSKKRKAAVAAEEEESNDEPPPPVKITKKRNSGAAQSASTKSRNRPSPSADLKAIRLMTTGFTLPDDGIKTLTKLGVKMTTKPLDCTHLVAPHIVRTEKFLCGLAVAPVILSDKWALDSAAAKEILPDDDYILEDPANETKYDFKLSDALSRAKETGGRPFIKKIFYVTPKVPVDMKLLKNVVTACGGQFSTQTPTLRILDANKDRHVISCTADVSIWRPLVGRHPIYNHELLLTGALRQQLDWEDPSFQVSGSS